MEGLGSAFDVAIVVSALMWSLMVLLKKMQGDKKSSKCPGPCAKKEAMAQALVPLRRLQK